MRERSWLALPFLGGGSSRKARKGSTSEKSTHTSNRPNGSTGSSGPNGLDGADAGAHVEFELQRQHMVQDYTTMNEEDVVQDYNSPIHMCTSSS